MRQYERADCSATAVEGQKLEIAETPINAHIGGTVDKVLIFGNPETREIVWVPYKSVVEIDGELYKVKRGNLDIFVGSREFTRDQSVECLSDKNGRLHSMNDFIDREATVKKINSSRLGNLSQYLFDWQHKKLEPVNTYSFEQLERYGLLKPWKTDRAITY